MPGCCLVALLLTIGPRIVLVLMWLFSNYLSRAFGGWLLPLLGFFFLPWTTIAYAFVINSGIGLGLVGILIVIGGLLLDIGSHGGGYRARRRTVAYD